MNLNIYRVVMLVWAVWAMATIAHSQPQEQQQVLAVDSLWNRYRLESNVQKLEELLVDDWTLTHSDGKIQKKKEYLDELQHRTRQNQMIKNEEVIVRQYDKTAIVTGISVQSGISEGKSWGGKFRFTRVWLYLNHRWMMVNSHSSKITTP